MDRQIVFALCAGVVLLAGCPKDKPNGGEPATADGGAVNATGGSSGGNSHSGGTSGGSGGSGNSQHMGSGGGGDHGSIGTDAGSGQAGHDSQPGSGGDSGVTDSGVTDSSVVDSGVVDSGTKRFCGGIAAGAFPCPGLSECIDDPSDDCDPNHGGADCGGICDCNKAASCIQGKHWNGSPDVCDCQADDGSDNGPACGKTQCAKDMECCNASCGTCVMPGTFCTQIACGQEA